MYARATSSQMPWGRLHRVARNSYRSWNPRAWYCPSRARPCSLDPQSRQVHAKYRRQISASVECRCRSRHPHRSMGTDSPVRATVQKSLHLSTVGPGSVLAGQRPLVAVVPATPINFDFCRQVFIQQGRRSGAPNPCGNTPVYGRPADGDQACRFPACSARRRSTARTPLGDRFNPGPPRWSWAQLHGGPGSVPSG